MQENIFKKNFTPRSNDILVEVKYNNENTTKSGIYLGPKTNISDRSTRGKIIKLGKNVSRELKINDIVIWDIVSGIDLYLDKEKHLAYILLREDSILGIIS